MNKMSGPDGRSKTPLSMSSVVQIKGWKLPEAESPSPLPSEADQAAPGTISTRDLLEPIFMRTFYVGSIAPFLFAFLGSLNVLAPYVEQARWLVASMAPIWPALPPQYQLVLETRGPGHAASYAFMCAALWTWPVIVAAVALREHARRRKQILPISRKEIGQFVVVLLFAFYFLVADTTTSGNHPLIRFRADQWGFFYLRSWFLFSITALLLAILVYAIGRVVLDRTLRRAA